MPIPTRSTAERIKGWSDYWDNLLTDQAAVQFLLFLKRLRDEDHDTAAGQVLEELAKQWVSRVYRA